MLGLGKRRCLMSNGNRSRDGRICFTEFVHNRKWLVHYISRPLPGTGLSLLSTGIDKKMLTVACQYENISASLLYLRTGQLVTLKYFQTYFRYDYTKSSQKIKWNIATFIKWRSYMVDQHQPYKCELATKVTIWL
jgi:hypothetical protein